MSTSLRKYRLTCAHDDDNDFILDECDDGGWVRAADVDAALTAANEAGRLAGLDSIERVATTEARTGTGDYQLAMRVIAQECYDQAMHEGG